MGYISPKTRVMLWGRAASRCAFPGCRLKLDYQTGDDADPSLVGEVCHIVADAPGGPRADTALPQESKDGYSNLLLLCANHHKVIDDRPREFTVDALRAIKRDHEAWVEENLSDVDRKQQRIREAYASILSEWESKAHIAKWNAVSSNLSGWYPQIYQSTADDLADLRAWTASRWWPGELPILEGAFVNFAEWAEMALYVLYRHSHAEGELYFTPKFYQISEWDEERYSRIFEVWNTHIKLMDTIVVELCKAANLVAALSRKHVLPDYRTAEGKFRVADTFVESTGPFKNVFEYTSEEIGRDGLVFQRSELFRLLTTGEI